MRHRVLIIGGGTAGITVAARLRKGGVEDVAVLEPSERHWYQPLWTLVGAGLASVAETVRPEARVMPSGVQWIRERAQEIDPEAQTVTTAEGSTIGYDFLVVAAGIQIDWGLIPGLEEGLAGDHVGSIYSHELAPRMARMVERFEGGTAIFTSPATPIKCGGAPQKIMYLTADHLRKKGVLDRSNVIFANAGKVIFGVEPFRTQLQAVVDDYGIDARHRHNLIEVRPEAREAVFEVSDEDGNPAGTETLGYDLLHVSPPMSAPDFIKNSPLAESGPYGFVDVDKHTLQHVRYGNVFALGDTTNTPNAKTGAAVRAQAPVLVENLMAAMEGQDSRAGYKGYGSCPLLTAHNRMLLAEFDYSGEPDPSFPLFITGKPRYSMFLLKRYGLPWLYWNLMLKGKA